MFKLDEESTRILQGKVITGVYYFSDYSSMSIPQTRPVIQTDDGSVYWFNGWKWIPSTTTNRTPPEGELTQEKLIR